MNEVANKMYRIITRTCNGIFLAVFMLLPLKVSAQTITLSDASEWEKDGKTFARVEDHLEVVITGINNLKLVEERQSKKIPDTIEKRNGLKEEEGTLYHPLHNLEYEATVSRNSVVTIQATLKRSGDIGKLESNEEILEITSVYAHLPELPLREELYYLCKNECPNMHICSDFESDTKVSISKPGQGIAGLKRYA